MTKIKTGNGKSVEGVGQCMKYEAMITSIETVQGYKAGICMIKTRGSGAGLEGLADSIGQCNFIEGRHDCYKIDYILYKAVRSARQEDVVAVGCNVSIGWMHDNTGGIIGSPHQVAESSDDKIEMINEDLAMYSSPGAIGLVAQCRRSAMESIVEIIDFSLTGRELVEEVMAVLSRMAIDTAILTTDASGDTADGYVAMIDRGFARMIHIG